VEKVNELLQRIREMLVYYRDLQYTGNIIFTLTIFFNKGGVKNVRLKQEVDM